VPAYVEVDLAQAVTFLVGENGSGKSTFLEAVAALCGYHVLSGGKSDGADDYGHEKSSELARALRPSFRRKPSDGFFFRAESFVNFASLLDQRREDPDFWGDPYARYGGKSLHQRSHGEAFLEVFKNRVEEGLFLLDEPEAALSPQRQLALLALMSRRVKTGATQFIVATHSPVLLTFPGSVIVSFDHGALRRVKLEETQQFQITKGILEHPASFWRHLGAEQG
jgi:predicted ATPase